jgi:Fic family protein
MSTYDTLASRRILEKLVKRRNEMPPIYYAFVRGKRFRNTIEKEAIIHSVRMEEIEKGYNSKTAFNRGLRENIKNLKQASQISSLYNGYLDSGFIEGIGRSIDPLDNKEGFRKKIESKTMGSFGYVTIRGATKNPPAPEKIENEMNGFIEENNNLEDIIDKAIHAHFHIARIHPFFDGNGRTARLIQNIILAYGKYPPIIIKEDERDEYCSLLDNAVSSYWFHDRKRTKEQGKFYNYLVSKIDKSFDEIEEIMDKIINKAIKR